MNKARFETTELEQIYKNIFVCKKCGITFGHDGESKTKLCPFCERDLFRPRGRKKLS